MEFLVVSFALNYKMWRKTHDFFRKTKKTKKITPRKESIAFDQSYFALQTRKQELLEKRIDMLERLEARQKLSQIKKELSSTLYEHGVDDQGFARI